MPSVKSVGGSSPVMPEQLPDRQPEPLPGQVVERDVDGALERAVVGDGRRHQPGRVLERGAHVVQRAAEVALDRLEGREEAGRDGGHRLGRVAVVRIRVALAEPDRPVGAVGLVAQRHDDRGDRPSLAVRRARDDERVPQRQPQRPHAGGRASSGGPACRPGGGAAPCASTHGSASTPASISRHSASPPNRTGSSVGRPVSAAIASMIRRASASSAMSDVLSATATTFDGATSPRHLSRGAR